MDRTHDGRSFRVLVNTDEYTRECLAVVVGRSLKSEDVIGVPADLMAERGVPRDIRSDNGTEFTSKAVRTRLENLFASILFIEPGSPYRESFNGKLRDELLDREIFYTLLEAKILIEN